MYTVQLRTSISTGAKMSEIKQIDPSLYQRMCGIEEPVTTLRPVVKSVSKSHGHTSQYVEKNGSDIFSMYLKYFLGKLAS